MKLIPANVDDQYERYPEMKREEVLKLVQWLKKQPHMPNLSEMDAMQFFYACYYSMELTKRTIDTNLTIRAHCSEFFHNLDIERSELKRVMSTIGVIPLAKSTPEGYKVIIGRLANTDASNFNFADTMKFYFMLFDFWLVESGIEPGYIIVVDMKGVTLGHLARLGLLTMKKFLVYLQEAAPVRLMGFHFINIVPFMDKLMSLMNPFMKKELQALIQIHSNLEKFYNYVPKEMLPSDYGGLEPDSNTIKETFYKKMVMNREPILEYGIFHQINEKLRPGKPKNELDLFGIEGNFKKLDID